MTNDEELPGTASLQMGPEHYEGCRRGELKLSTEERATINQMLGNAWRFVPIPASSRGLTFLNARYSGAMNAPSKVTGKANKSASTASSHCGKNLKKNLPEWAVTFQRLMTAFLQSEIVKPFAERLPHVSDPLVIAANAVPPGISFSRCTEANPASGASSSATAVASQTHVTRSSTYALHQREIQQAIAPYCAVTSLRQVLSKVENGQYQSCLEAFNEVYQFLLGGFRHYPPASPHWMMVHQMTSLFFSMLAAFPLRDDFTGPPSITEVSVTVSTKSTQPKVKSTTAPHGGGGTKKSKRAQDPSLIGLDPDHLPLKRKEARTLHRMFNALSPELHSMLYKEFQTKATWRECTQGEIQIDEEQTAPAIFREMTRWCASRVTLPMSSSKKKRPLESAPVGAGLGRSTGINLEVPAVDQSTTTQVERFADWVSSDEEAHSSSSSSSSEDEEEEEPAPQLTIPSTL